MYCMCSQSIANWKEINLMKETFLPRFIGFEILNYTIHRMINSMPQLVREREDTSSVQSQDT